MFSSYFSRTAVSEAPTPFNQAVEFKAINASILEIKNKRDSLKIEAETKGASSLEFVKWNVLDQLTKKLDEKISAYNANADSANMQAKLALGITLYDCVNEAWTQSDAALKLHRNENKQMLGSIASYGIWAGAIAAGVCVPLSFVGSGLLTYYLTKKAANKTAKNMGWYDYESHTSKIVRTLKDELSKMISSLRYMSGERNAVDPALFGTESDARRQSRTVARDAFWNTARAAITGRSNTSGAALLEEYSPATKEYIDKMKSKIQAAGNNVDRIARLKLSDEEAEIFVDLKDPVTLEVLNLPVLLNGKVYELDSLVGIIPASNGQRKDPTNRYTFYLRDIQPAWDVADEIDTLIKEIQAKKNGAVQAVSATSSAEAATSAATNSTTATNSESATSSTAIEPQRLAM